MSEKILEISQLSEKLLDLMSDIQNKIEVTLTREGVPFAKINPLNFEPKTIPKAGLNRGSMIMIEDFDQPLPDEFWGL